MPTFNIVLIDPTGQSTTRGLHDVAHLLYFSFQSLGHSVTLQTNHFETDATNVVLGYERLPEGTIPAGIRYIPYQLEQVAPGGTSFSASMQQILRAAAEVWDYNPQNAHALQQIGVKSVKLLPIGFHEKLHTIQPREEDIDVIFYGMMNDRRMRVLEAVAGHCSVRHLQFLYGPERDAWIARSKIVLNLHFFDARIAEQVRVSYLLNNRRCVVSEASAWDPLAGLCITAPYDLLPQACVTMVRDTDRRTEATRAGFEGFRQRPMTEYLRRVLE